MIKKTHWLLGYNSLSIMMDQERKHWLMKTDKKKTLIDPVTRDQYIGQIDNLGSDIVIETEKKDSIAKALQDLHFNGNADKVLELQPSAFTYSCAVNGFLFARITSTNYPTNLEVDDFEEDNTLIEDLTPTKKHFRIGFKEAKKVILPFGGSNNTDEVFATKWICSNQVYLEWLDDETGKYGEDDGHRLLLTLNDTNVVGYYPLAETLQPLQLEEEAYSYFHTVGITDDQMIGYPAFWLTCNETNIGPSITIADQYNYSNNHNVIWAFGNAGNAPIYNGFIYAGIDGDYNATPNDDPTDEVYIEAIAFLNMGFMNTPSDFRKNIKGVRIGGQDAPFVYTGDETKIYMVENDGWEYVDQHTYRIKVSAFDANCVASGMNPLTPVFRIAFDQTLDQWISTTKDVGYAGIRMNSGNPYSDMYRNYPHNLNAWDGIPEYMRKMEVNHIPEHMAVYALHNSPSYSEEIPDSRQTAALLFDLGEQPDLVYDYKVHYAGTSDEIPDGCEEPYIYMNYVRWYSKEKFNTSKMSIYYEIYKNLEKNKQDTENGETWRQWQVRLQEGWTTEAQNEIAKDYGYYDWLWDHKWVGDYEDYLENPDQFQISQDVIDEIFGNDDDTGIGAIISQLRYIYSYPGKNGTIHAIANYDTDGKLISVDDEFLDLVNDTTASPQLSQEQKTIFTTCYNEKIKPMLMLLYSETNASQKVTLVNLLKDIVETLEPYDGYMPTGNLSNFFTNTQSAVSTMPTLTSVVLSEDEFKSAIIAMFKRSVREWINYDGSAYLTVDKWFGIILTDTSQMDEGFSLVNNIELVVCYTTDETTGQSLEVCTLALEMYANGKIQYAAMYRFGGNGINISDGFWHIDRIRLASDVGADVEQHKDVKIEFDLYVLDEVNDIGRVYVLSNDDTTYVNNAHTDYPKPDRTVARICDIPTSVVQLTGLSNVAPISVVDPKYTRTELSFTADDKDQLYNKMPLHWVRPCDDRYPGTGDNASDNDYVFTSVEDLSHVDMTNPKFKRMINLNQRIDPTVVEAGLILEAGSGYIVGDIGFVYVGGFAFQYGVLSVNASGGVTQFNITAIKQDDQPNKTYPDISLSNFELQDTMNGYTKKYGTSPLTGKGTGFKCTLYIPDILSYNIQYGSVFDDLFALMRKSDGLWLYEYNATNGWTENMLLAPFENGSSESLFQTTTDAYMSYILPTKRNMEICQYADHMKTIEDLKVLSTSTFVNVIDTTHTPIQTDLTMGETSHVNEVDFCKFRCTSFSHYVAKSRTWESAYEVLESKGLIQQDCYIAFRWAEYPVDSRDSTGALNSKEFWAAIIKRSFNHVLATDKFSMLPENRISIQNGIHSNTSSTIVWDVPNVGPMMWIFNPSYMVHEKYHIDKEQNGFYIERTPLTWKDIDIYTPVTNYKDQSLNNQNITSLFINDKLDFDIYTNSPYDVQPVYDSTDEDPPIYKLPTFRLLVERETMFSDITTYQNPIGNWMCVFPRVNTFTFEKDDSDTKNIPIQMQAIHVNNVVNTSKLLNDETGQDESERTIIFEDTLDGGVRVKVFNTETSRWETI